MYSTPILPFFFIFQHVKIREVSALCYVVFFHCFQDCASWFMGMCAVVEAAVFGEVEFKGINVDITEEGVQFTWNPVPKDNAGNDDQVMVIVYNSDKEIAVHDINAGKRSSSATKIKFPDDWNGDSIETYIAFKKADGSVVSDSIYCGCFKI